MVVVNFKLITHRFPGRTLMFILFECYIQMLNEQQNLHVIEVGERKIICDELERIASNGCGLFQGIKTFNIPKERRKPRTKNIYLKYSSSFLSFEISRDRSQ